MTLKNNLNFEETLIFPLKNDIKNFLNSNPSSGMQFLSLKNTEQLCREKWLMVSKMT